MASEYLAVAGGLSFGVTFLFTRWLIRSLRGSTVVGVDIHKPDHRRVPEMGGLAVLVGFYAGMGFLVLLAAEDIARPLYYSALLACFGAGFVGILDDLISVRQRVKALLPFLFSIPLGILVYLRGDTDLLGIDIGLGMLFLVPVGITSAANAANMLEGFNGLGAGLGAIMAAGLTTLALLIGAQEGLFLLVPLLGSLLAFLWYNRYPSKVFPGDSMTLLVGASVASAAIISSPSFKFLGLVLFVPMIVEFLLKARGRFRAENYGTITPDGRLRYEGRLESLAHLLMRRGAYREWQVVAILWGVEGILVLVLLAALSVGAWR